MKKCKRLLSAVLCMSILLSNTTLCYASTGSAYTPYGTVDGYAVQGTLNISTNNAYIRTGYVNITSQGKAYFTYVLEADWWMPSTNQTGSRVTNWSYESLGISSSISPPTYCNFVGGRSSHSAYKNGSSWSAELGL